MLVRRSAFVSAAPATVGLEGLRLSEVGGPAGAPAALSTSLSRTAFPDSAPSDSFVRVLPAFGGKLPQGCSRRLSQAPSRQSSRRGFGTQPTPAVSRPGSAISGSAARAVVAASCDSTTSPVGYALPPADSCTWAWDTAPGATGLQAAPDAAFVRTLSVVRYGGVPTIFAGGRFSTSGGRRLENIGWRDGREWQSIIADSSSASVPGRVNAMAVAKFSLFIGGEFAGGLLEWDGRSDPNVVNSNGVEGRALNGSVRGMMPTKFWGSTADGRDYLWLVGDFDGVPGYEGELPGYAWYDGQYYGSVEGLSAPHGASVVAESESGNGIYLGGARFDVEGLGSATGVLYFGSGGEVSSLGNGIVGFRQIDAILAINDLMYVAGDFDGVAHDGVVVPDTAFMAAWDGRRWRSVGVFDGPVRALAAVNAHVPGATKPAPTTPSEVWAGGEFRAVDGVTFNGLSRRVESHWLKVGGAGWPGVAGGVSALAQLGFVVWVGGGFAAVNAGRVRNVAALSCGGRGAKRGPL